VHITRKTLEIAALNSRLQVIYISYYRDFGLSGLIG